MIKYQQKNVAFAKELRKNMTPWERKIWFDFLRTYSVKVYRQKAIDNYIVDFYCAKAKLVIELDGGAHFENDNLIYDELRTKRLNEMGIKVMRISNKDIDSNFYEVCEMIDREVQNQLLKK